jgi:amidophosphoribosyltransferase
MPGEYELAEKCGVFGVFTSNPEAARLVYSGLWALQHRGQESSGIASSDRGQIYRHVQSGLVSHAYDEAALDGLKGSLAIGHNRYSTSGGNLAVHGQPIVDVNLALAHNGNLPSTAKLEEFLSEHNVPIEGLNDSALMAAAISFFMSQGKSLDEAIEESYPLLVGAFSVVAMDCKKLVAFRDHCGIRPLSLGRLADGLVVSSETCALDVIGAAFWRDIKPGEMVVIDESGLRSRQLVKPTPKLDIFEFVYFARPDSMLLGRSVNAVRREMGAELAREVPLSADVVVPVPDSAIPAAIGYARQSGIPFDQALIKNRYIHRTFIQPAQRLRDKSVEMKLNPLPEALIGRDVIVIDDSIVRGTTTKKIVRMLYGAGAKKVHVLISSPPVKFPDFYGIDTPDPKDLLASRMSIDEMTGYIGADSLHFLSYEGLIAATGLPESRFSTSAFTGVYPIDIGEKAAVLK